MQWQPISRAARALAVFTLGGNQSASCEAWRYAGGVFLWRWCVLRLTARVSEANPIKAAVLTWRCPIGICDSGLLAECQEENALKISSISSRNTSKIANAKME